jgi:hypothetical protein
MALQELSLGSKREELIVMPSNKEFEELSEHKEKYKLENDGTLILKNKLVMREGKHNEVNYTWEELKASYMTGEGAGLFYDHDDSVKNYTGLVKNLRADEDAKEILGDIHVTNKQAALDISLGAKWGISPTIEAEKILVDGEKYAKDSLFLSYALVLRPAVRETMLNSEKDVYTGERRFMKVEKNERELEMLAEKDKRILKLEEEKETAEKKIEESEKKVEEAEKKAEDAEKKIEESEKKEVEKESEDLCAMECSIGFTSEANKNSRLEELKSLSSESRNLLKSTHEKYVKTLKLGEDGDDGEADAEKLKDDFLTFRKKYMESNPDATSEEVKAAFAKLSDNEGEDGNDNEDLKSNDPQVRMRAELASGNKRSSKVNSDILAYMKEQERK